MTRAAAPVRPRTVSTAALYAERDLALRVAGRRDLAVGVIELSLERADGHLMPPWQPGAHVELDLPGIGIRQFSLTGDRSSRQMWRIAVYREPVGRGGSAYLHEHVRPGTPLTAVGPRNRFRFEPPALLRTTSSLNPFLPPTTAEDGPVVLVAGGIGITPLVPMAQAAAATGADWRLAYLGRDRATMAYADEVAALGSRARLLPRGDRAAFDLDRFVAGEGPVPGTRVWCCGPGALMARVRDLCGQIGAEYHGERFVPGASTAVLGAGERSFVVELRQLGRGLRVGADESITEAMERAGIPPRVSCRVGMCGTCETRVLAGVPDHRDELLDDEERAEGDRMMLCVSRSLSERLVLDL